MIIWCLEKWSLMEEAQYEFIKGGERYMTNEITKDGDVEETGKGEKRKEIHAHNSWMKYVFMLIYFLFSYVIGNLINLCADEGEPIDNLFVGQRKEELEYSNNYKHILE